MKIITSSKPVTLFTICLITLSISTEAFSTAAENEVTTSALHNVQSEQINDLTPQQARPIQPRFPQPRRSQFPRSSETTRLIDGKIVNTQQLVDLGSLLYHDSNLSNPIGQSCASCHDINNGFTDPNSANPSSVGADQQSFGIRNSPTTSYSAFIPPQRLVQTQRRTQRLIGGLFVDGRVQSLEEQAKMPFLNPNEMGNTSVQEVVAKISESTYASDFEFLFGEGILLNPEQAYNYIVDAIAAFERSDILSPFSSKFDRVQAGTISFTAAEERGLNIFNTKGQCQVCHTMNRSMFTNFTYRNIGVPSNPQLLAIINAPDFIDIGLGSITQNPLNDGQFRVPTLRNIAKTSPYIHNGIFTTLREVIEFYNTRVTTFSLQTEVNRNVAQGGRLG